MSAIKGVQGVLAFHPSTTWGTARLLGAGDGVGLVSESLKPDVQLIEDQQLEGSSTQRQGEAGNRMFAGDIVTGFRYEGLEPLLACVMGTAGTPATVDVTARTHTFKPKTDMDGIYGTMAIDKGFEVHEYPSVKVLGFSLSCKQGERAQITFRFACYDQNITTSSGTGTNNNVTMASVTLPTNRDYALFKHMVVKSNAQAGAALDSTSVIHVSGVTIDVDRGYKVDDVTTQFGNKIDEPRQDGWTVCKVALDFSKYSDTSPGGNNALYAAQLTKDAQKMSIVLTGESLAGSSSAYYSLACYFNGVQFMGGGGPNLSGPGLTPFTLDGMAYRVSTSPTGFVSGYNDPLTIDLTSQRALDGLSST